MMCCGMGVEMSEWIESHASLPRHRKTRRLSRLLSIPVPLAVGYLHMLWYYALEFAPGGDLSDHSIGDIEDGCGWDGEPDALVRALVDAGWLSNVDGLMVHDWEDYNQSHRKRAAEAERQRRKRAKERGTGKQDANPHDQWANEDLSQNVTGMPVTVTPDRTGQDRTGQDIREEAASPVDNSPGLSELVALAITEVPKSESTEDDYRRTIERYRPKFSDAHIERIIMQLGNYRPTKPRPKLHLTLANWLSKEPRDALPPSHVPFKDMSPREGDVPPTPEFLVSMGKIGRAMP